MGNWERMRRAVLLLTSLALAPPMVRAQPTSGKGQPAQGAQVAKLARTNVKTEWEAFKNKDKKAYSDLLAEDFLAVEDDNQGQRNKNAATG